MVVKFYISMVSGNKEMKKRQMKAQLIMESKGVNFKVIDICDPNNEDERTFMRKNAVGRNNARNAVPPQFFNDDHEDSYCGDYEGFDEAVENDRIEEFLKLPRGSLPQVPIINHNISTHSSRDVSLEKEVVAPQVNGAVPSPRQSPEKVKEEEVKEEEEKEEEEEEEVEDEGEDEDSMEMETTVATADSLTELKYKKLPGGDATTAIITEEEVKVQEADEEEDDEEEETALPHEDDSMEMSTTVATAERFTEFSYKQLPGEV